MRESKVEAHLVKRVKAMGGEVRKVKWIGRRGAPDRLVMLPDVLFWVETKAPDGFLEPHQAREHDRMRAMGQVVHVAYTIEAIDSLMNQYGRAPT